MIYVIAAILLVVFLPSVFAALVGFAGTTMTFIILLFILSAIGAGIWVLSEKIYKKRKFAKLKPIYDKQLKELGSAALFFAEVQPILTKKKYEDYTTEERVKVRKEIEAIARECGCDLEAYRNDKNSAFFSIYFRLYENGFAAIREAQDKYILEQKKGKEILFYLCIKKLVSDIHKVDHPNFYRKECDDIIEYLRKYSIADLSNFNRDEDKLIAINAYNEGAAAYQAWVKEKQIIPYYYELLRVTHYEFGAPDVNAKSLNLLG